MNKLSPDVIKRIPFSEDDVLSLKKLIKVNDFCAKLLLSRGVNPEYAEKYLYGKLSDLSDPFAYSGMKEAVDAVRDCIEKGKKIVVYGDYDCDGIGAVSILMRAFRDQNALCDYYIPVRADEGYGLHCESIERIRDEKKADMILTVDCGITSWQEVDLCKKLGMDIVITDHHRPDERAPDCIVVDPCLNPELTPLCGAGVALYLVRGLFGEEVARRYLDICALSTIADIVPLVEDNRIIVRYGLELIKQGFGKPGIKALLASADILQRNLTPSDVGFRITPRINAAGRLSSAEKSIRILTTDDPTEANLIADELSIQNAERQNIEKRIVESAMEKAKKYDFSKYKIIVLCDDEWEAGVNGIAASKLTDYFYLPTILMTRAADGLLKGSARSIAGVNIHEMISTQKELLCAFGGHTMAAGLSLEEKNLQKFIEGINNEICKIDENVFNRKYVYDFEFSMFDVTEKNVEILRYFEPFGYGNPAPIFLDPAPSVKFSKMKGRHLKGKTRIGDVVCFQKGYLCDAFNQAEDKYLLYGLEKNFFNGNESVQIRVKELFFTVFQVQEEESLSNFCAFSVFSKKSQPKSKERKQREKDLSLDVFFQKSEYEDYLRSHPDTVGVYCGGEGFVRKKTAVLSPSIGFPFAYYGKVTVHGELTEDMTDYFSTIGAKFADLDIRLNFETFDINEMRSTYVLLTKILSVSYGYKFFSEKEFFLFLQKRGYSFDYKKFVLHFYILLDVELLKWENGAILLTNAKKVDLDRSSIYRLIHGKNA